MKCPYCKEEVKQEAFVCKYCKSKIYYWKNKPVTGKKYNAYLLEACFKTLIIVFGAFIVLWLILGVIEEIYLSVT